MPAYNASEWIEEALLSVIASKYRPIEVIVMDDGSKDDTLVKAQAFAEKHREVIVYSQPNSGASAARNHAIRLSHGTYILPVDADNIIDPLYIPEAVNVLEKRKEVKVVSCRADFFGDRTGEWKFPKFSKRLLARKNMIDTCAMYRRADYDMTSGYMENCIAREDWDFWLSIFEHGGEFVRLPDIRLHYRVRAGSKRVTDRLLKRQVVDAVNQRHADYMRRYLGGPLHYHRSWSRAINFFRTEKQVGSFDHWLDGTIIYDKRNIGTGFGALHVLVHNNVHVESFIAFRRNLNLFLDERAIDNQREVSCPDFIELAIHQANPTIGTPGIICLCDKFNFSAIEENHGNICSASAILVNHFNGYKFLREELPVISFVAEVIVINDIVPEIPMFQIVPLASGEESRPAFIGITIASSRFSRSGLIIAQLATVFAI